MKAVVEHEPIPIIPGPPKEDVTAHLQFTWTCTCGHVNVTNDDPRGVDVDCADCGLTFHVAKLQ